MHTQGDRACKHVMRMGLGWGGGVELESTAPARTPDLTGGVFGGIILMDGCVKSGLEPGNSAQPCLLNLLAPGYLAVTRVGWVVLSFMLNSSFFSNSSGIFATECRSVWHE